MSVAVPIHRSMSAVSVAKRDGADGVPAKGAVVAADPVLAVEVRPGDRGVLPGLLGAFDVIGVDQREPVPAVVGLRRQSGVLGALLVEVRRRPVRRGGKDDVRHGLGDELRAPGASPGRDGTLLRGDWSHYEDQGVPAGYGKRTFVTPSWCIMTISGRFDVLRGRLVQNRRRLPGDAQPRGDVGEGHALLVD